MSRPKLSKKTRLRNAMFDGKSITVMGAMTRFGFASPNSVTATISALRAEGYRIKSRVTRFNRFAYYI